MESYSQGAVLSTNQRAGGMCPPEFESFYEPVPAVYMLFLCFLKRNIYCGYPIPELTLNVRYASLVTSLQIKHHLYPDLI